MKNLTLIFLFCLFISCAEDEEDTNRQHYNIDSLSLEHRILFRDAMLWWNDRDIRANFYERKDSKTKASYEELPSGISGRMIQLLENNLIIFSSSVIWYPTRFCGIARHELGHTFISIHSLDPEDVMYSYAPFCDRDEV